jgi:hypothetical protein
MMTLKEMGAALVSLIARSEGAIKAEVESIRATVNDALTKAQADLAEAGKTIAGLTKDKEKLTTDLQAAQEATNTKGGEIKAANDKLVSFLTSLKLVPKEGATILQNTEAATTAITAALASQGVKIENIPPTEAEQGGASKTTLAAQVEAITDPVEKSKFIQKNMAALQAEVKAGMKAK